MQHAAGHQPSAGRRWTRRAKSARAGNATGSAFVVANELPLCRVVRWRQRGAHQQLAAAAHLAPSRLVYASSRSTAAFIAVICGPHSVDATAHSSNLLRHLLLQLVNLLQLRPQELHCAACGHAHRAQRQSACVAGSAPRCHRTHLFPPANS
jgi:hypothetical protein